MSTAPYRILVTGSRDWTDERTVAVELDRELRKCVFAGMVVVHGHCPTGADAIADQWAVRINRLYPHTVHPPERHPADWDRQGKRAGMVRNAEMVRLGADVCLAFLCHCSRTTCPRRDRPHDSHGAAHCMRLAGQAGIPVRTWWLA